MRDGSSGRERTTPASVYEDRLQQDPRRPIHIHGLGTVASAIGLDTDEAGRVGEYLVGEGLMEWAYMGGGIAITHRGIKEVEQALRTPERRTEHFAPAINLINVGQMTGSIQQGTVSSVQVTTQTLAPSEAEGVKRFLASLADVKHDLGLNAEATAEIDSQIATIESQMTSARPKRGILKEAVTGVLEVLASAPGREAVEEVLKHIPEWLHR